MEKVPLRALIVLEGKRHSSDKNKVYHNYMKTMILLLAVSFKIASTWAQATSSASPQPSAVDSANSGAANITFTNRAGAAFSVEQLASQLQNLRSAVDEILPTLTAFNESFPATNAASTGWKGTLSGLVSGALQKTSDQNTATTQGQTPSTWDKTVSALRGLLNKNSPTSAPVNPNAQRDLVTLQNSLQPVVPILQDLNVVSGANSGQISGGSTNRVLSPTGR